MRPMTIKYREGRKTVTIKADSCSGEIPAYSNIYHCNFYDKSKKQIASVPEKNLLPGYYEAYKKLFGRPWMAKIRTAPKIALNEYHGWEDRLSGYPKDTITIWMVNYDQNTWVIVAGDFKTTRAILHVMNNPEITKRGVTAQEAIKKLFPGKEVHLLVPTTTLVKL